MSDSKEGRVLPAPVIEALERRIIGEWLKRFLSEQKKTAGTGEAPTVYAVRADELVKELGRSKDEKK